MTDATPEPADEPEPGPPQHSRYDPAHWPTRAKVAALAVLAAVALIIVLAVVLWPRSVTVHGIQIDDTGTTFSTGTQVVIEAPDGSVIGQGTLTENAKLEAQANKGFNPAAAVALGNILGTTPNPATVFTWTVTVPSETRYGIKVGNAPIFWVPGDQMAKGPVLTYGSNG